MYDINFLMKLNELDIPISQSLGGESRTPEMFEIFESIRSPQPYLFNIETTNVCNMTCVMCPRTRLMNRPVKTMNLDMFKKVIDQVTPHPKENLEMFYRYVQENIGIKKSDRSENAFYYYIVSSHLILHGYGEPLLDKTIPEKVLYCSKKSIPTYFSCVPVNIDNHLMEKLFDAGIDVIKFSMDGMDDQEQKRIRGRKNDFSRSFRNIMDVLNLKERLGSRTEIVVTLIEMSDSDKAKMARMEFERLWERYPVYSYVKSQDNRWHYKESENFQNRSHYVDQFCVFPWTSLTVMVDGSVVPCTQDYNTEIRLGNVREMPLTHTWNSNNYMEFRRKHMEEHLEMDLKCIDRCDLKTFSQFSGTYRS